MTIYIIDIIFLFVFFHFYSKKLSWKNYCSTYFFRRTFAGENTDLRQSPNPYTTYSQLLSRLVSKKTIY